jgi:hypothetical protein
MLEGYLQIILPLLLQLHLWLLLIIQPPAEQPVFFSYLSPLSIVSIYTLKRFGKSKLDNHVQERVRILYILGNLNQKKRSG